MTLRGCIVATALAALTLGCASHRRAGDASPPAVPDAGHDAGVDTGIDAARPTSCTSPEPLVPGVARLATADGPSPCSEGDVTFFTVTIPEFSQMVPLAGTDLPEVIGDCTCEVPYHESTVGYGEPLVLVATGRPGALVGYDLEMLEPNAACAGAIEVPLGATTEPTRLDRAGARIAICGDVPRRPLYFVVEDTSATTLHVETDAPPGDRAPFVVGIFQDACESREGCGLGVRSESGAPLDVALPPGNARYAMVALLEPRRGISVLLRAD